MVVLDTNNFHAKCITTPTITEFNARLVQPWDLINSSYRTVTCTLLYSARFSVLEQREIMEHVTYSTEFHLICLLQVGSHL
jgi:hypothetical protein